ncbi:sulfur carrier protein ThiS [Luedemannella flava]|uniref:Sulfur carrier protein ThiS n=1 Tax=Luedemannella flava TaxID=349316 RepID=A0ABN2LQ19_9ACTN
MNIVINGTPADVTDGWSVGDLVRARTEEQRRVAVARNSEVVPRGEWDTTALSEGDRIEVLAPVAGG